MTNETMYANMRNSISTGRDHRALVGAYTTSFNRTRPGIVASKSFVFSTGDANEFAETDTKLVHPEHFPGLTRTIVVVVYIDLSMSSATQRLAGVFVEQKRRRDLRNLFSLLHRQRGKTYGTLV